MRIGDRTKIQQNVYLGSGENVSIGQHCIINENVRLRNVSIGDYVLVAPGVTILGPGHGISIEIPMIFQPDEPAKTTVIEDDVWLCTNAIVKNGVKIGHGCIIGAGSVVTKDCVALGIYGGIPAHLIRMRE